MYKSIDFISFQNMFSTDKKCWDYLVKRRWSNGFICPKCQCKQFSYITTRKLFQCTNCRHQCSVTAGTVFHKTRTSLQLLFWLLYFIAYNKNGQSALDLTRKLKISYKVAWTMTQKIRTAMIDRDANYKLAGLIEFDDAYFGAKNVPGLRGRGADKKTPVLVVAQLDKNNNPQYASMIVVENLQKKNVAAIAKKNN